MSWPTTTGLRILSDSEAALVLAGTAEVAAKLISELTAEETRSPYGIEWFDQWDAPQRLWLLECVVHAMVTDERIESAAAMFDATADAIFWEIHQQLDRELNPGTAASGDRPRWTEMLRAAALSQWDEALDSTDTSEKWFQLNHRLADNLLGVRLYLKAESFRDRDYENTEAFLQRRGLPEDYLARIPPLRTNDEAIASYDRIMRQVER